MKTVFALMTTLMMVTTGFLAFAEGGRGCKADVEKFCKDIKPGGGRIIQCLKEHESELSETCKKKEGEMKEQMKVVRDACKADLEKFCKDVKPGEGRIVDCLKKNESGLSPACKAAKDKK